MNPAFSEYQRKFNLLWEGSEDLVRNFIRNKIDEGIEEGKWQSNSKCAVKTLYWISYIANDLYKQNISANELLLEERQRIISEAGFKPSANGNIDRTVMDTAFGAVSKFLVGTNSGREVCLRAVAIFDIDLDELDDWKTSREISPNMADVSPIGAAEVAPTKDAPKRKNEIIISLVVFIALCTSAYFGIEMTNEPKVEDKVADLNIMASSFFSEPIKFQSVEDHGIVLTGGDPYSSVMQQGTQLGLNSVTVRLTLRNNTENPLFIERFILQTDKKTQFQKKSSEKRNVNIKNGFELIINADKNNWDYVYNIIKDDAFSYLPPFSETDALISIKGDNSWDQESINFTFMIDPGNGNSGQMIECNRSYSIGFP